MRFTLVDRILEWAPGERIVAVKAVSRSEEYLADHFPTFEVLPGVLMLEALVEAARWLTWATEDFAHSLILLADAKNVTYKSFVRPGQTLRVEVNARPADPGLTNFTGSGFRGDTEVVKARFSLLRQNLAEKNAALAELDEKMRHHARATWQMLAAAN
jgi:3-hydroxyacyl-[acyl-carrier-protein] dehydratase